MSSQSSEEAAQAACLDALQQLLKAQIGQHVPLPQIVVVGDQSSGKSSIIQRLTGATIPSKEGLCTRFPMLLNMRFGEESTTVVTIVPAEDRRASEKAKFERFQRKVKNLNELEPVFEEVARVLGIDKASASSRFCKDVLKIDFTGPKNLNLALIDLPGLFQIGNRRQTKEDAEFVGNLIRHWIAQPRTVKLVVISAKTETVHHYSLKFLQETNQQQQRSIGAITHADYLVDEKGANFQDYAAVLAGQDQKLQYGWFILNNQAAPKGSSLEKGIADEAAYFSGKQWASVISSVKGIKALEQCLLRVQFETIKECLPDVIKEAQAELLSIKVQLKDLPNRQRVTSGLRRQIITAATDFSKAYRRTKGNSKLNAEQPEISLNYNVARNMADFNDAFRDALNGAIGNEDDSPSRMVQLIECDYSSALPGQLDFDMMARVFTECTSSWKRLTGTAIDDTVRDTQRYLLTLMEDKSLDGFEEYVVEPVMTSLRAALHAMVDPVFRSDAPDSIVSFDSTAQAHIGATRGSHVRQLFNTELEDIQRRTAKKGLPKSVEEFNYQMSELGEALERAAIDVDAFTERETEVCVRAQITDQFETINQRFNNNTVGTEVTRHISDIFSPMKVAVMDDSQLTKICSQSEDTRAEQELLEKNIIMIEAAIAKLQDFQARQKPNGVVTGQKHERDTTEDNSLSSMDIELIDDVELVKKWTPKTPMKKKSKKA